MPEEKAAFDAVVRSQVLAADETFSGATCAEATLEPIAVQPVKIADQPEIVVWREKVRLTGCGRTAVYNLNIARVGGASTWRMTYGLPGDTLADMQLQGSAVPAAFAQARVDLPGECQAMRMKDVYLAARPGGVDVVPPGAPLPEMKHPRPQVSLPDSVAPLLDQMDLTKAWMEVWPIEMCGHDRTLAVVFIPVRDGRRVWLFTPVWQFVAKDGPSAKPAAAPAE